MRPCRGGFSEPSALNEDPFPPFSVENRPGTYRQIRTVKDAAEFLLREWPLGGRGKKKRLAALNACLLGSQGCRQRRSGPAVLP